MTGVQTCALPIFFLIRFFLANRTQLAVRLGSAQAKIETLKKRESERSKWALRDAMLNEKMPVLGDSDVASKELRESVQAIAQKHTVTLESPSPGTPVNLPGHIALGVPDVYKACDEVKARGGRVVREAGPMKGGKTVIAFVEDPDGYKIELVEDRAR